MWIGVQWGWIPYAATLFATYLVTTEFKPWASCDAVVAKIIWVSIYIFVAFAPKVWRFTLKVNFWIRLTRICRRSPISSNASVCPFVSSISIKIGLSVTFPGKLLTKLFLATKLSNYWSFCSNRWTSLCVYCALNLVNFQIWDQTDLQVNVNFTALTFRVQQLNPLAGSEHASVSSVSLLGSLKVKITIFDQDLKFKNLVLVLCPTMAKFKLQFW